MESNELNEFIRVVSRFAQSTRSGEMQWTKVNPTTYSWSSDAGTVFLQQVSKNVRIGSGTLTRSSERKGYLFQAFDKMKNPQLAVNSAEQIDANGVLSELYDSIGASFTKKGVDFLKSMIGS